MKPGSRAQHYIADVVGGNRGPTIIAVAGIHGNEATGVSAIERVIKEIEPVKAKMKGRFLGLKGNIPALSAGVRFVDEDMNRLWTTSILDKIRRTKSRELSSIDRVEVKKMLQILDPIVIADESEEIIYVDLHTFSGSGGLFSITSDDERHSRILSKLGVPRIFGLQHSIPGTSMDYVEDAGHIGFAFETGTHGSKEAEDNAFAGLLVLLESIGMIDRSDITEYDICHDYLMSRVSGYPSKVQFLYKHIIEEGDEFVMRPGFQNFDEVQKGDWLASDRNGKIKALADGYLLMPLYQEQGNDGFFIVRDCD
ncbi:MAG: succinylglutamate desuccinylase/aspartoacylase family protein [Balneola sp.]